MAAEADVSLHPWAAKADAFLGHLVEIPAAVLVVAEVVVLFAGVVSLDIVAQSSVLAYGLRARAAKNRPSTAHPDAI